MKVQKYEIARVIDKLKSIVQKNDQFPALGGILVKDGYLIASNSEITMKAKLEASEGSYFIIPMKAFDLIKNLPDGEIDISATDKNVVMIKIGAIKNKYQSYPPEEFNFDITEDPEADGVELNGKKIMEAISHVIYAAADGGANVTFSGTTTDTSGVAEQVTTDLESALTDVPANGHASITLDQSNNAAEIYSLATADVVSAFSETIPADGHVDVTLDQTNNAAAIYSECAGQVQSTFSQGFTASADVAVTLNWHITNPSASISTSSSGSSVSATIAGHASGGEVGLNGAELSWLGEEGLEYIIPTVPARRQRGIELWKSAGRTLGVLGPDDEISAHASGGIVGKEVSNTIPYFDTDSSSQDSEKTEKETVPTNVVSDKSGIVVQVNLSPQFNISDTNDSDVIRLIKAHIKELADDLGSEIATMLSEAYENTPVTT